MASRLMKGGIVFAGLTVFLIAGSRSLAAAEMETPAAIRAAIENAMTPRLGTVKEAAVEVEVGAIDSRLRLPSCPTLRVVLPPTNAAVVTARVECDTPSWTIYVPIRLHAWVEAVVAAANLAPNTRLAADHLARARVDMFSGNGGLLTEPSQAEGKILRVGLLAGAPITTPLLELPIVVHRGQKVLLTLTDSTMIIKATAVALEEGRVGDSIAVENPDSKKTMHATVAKDGTVEIKF